MTKVQKEQDVITIAFSDTMDSASANTTWQQIEAELNALYEKTRLLEDIRDYAKAYITQQITEKRNKIADRLKVIESAADDFADKSHITHSVPFYGNSQIVYDRDGSAVTPMDDVNGKLEVGGTTLYNAAIQNVTTGSLQVEAELRDENFDNLKNHKPARCVYCVFYPVSGGIDKEITLMLRQNTHLNFISAKPANCTLKSITLILPNGTEKEIDPGVSSIDDIEVQAVRITMHAKLYTYSDRTINTERESSDSSWNTSYSEEDAS